MPIGHSLNINRNHLITSLLAYSLSLDVKVYPVITLRHRHVVEINT